MKSKSISFTAQLLLMKSANRGTNEKRWQGVKRLSEETVLVYTSTLALRTLYPRQKLQRNAWKQLPLLQNASAVPN